MSEARFFTPYPDVAPTLVFDANIGDLRLDQLRVDPAELTNFMRQQGMGDAHILDTTLVFSAKPKRAQRFNPMRTSMVYGAQKKRTATIYLGSILTHYEIANADGELDGIEALLSQQVAASRIHNDA